VTAIFTYIWLEFMINVDKYSIHEACGYDQVLFGVISNSKLMKDDDLPICPQRDGVVGSGVVG